MKKRLKHANRILPTENAQSDKSGLSEGCAEAVNLTPNDKEYIKEYIKEIDLLSVCRAREEKFSFYKVERVLTPSPRLPLFSTY